jgi:plasminogen activator
MRDWASPLTCAVMTCAALIALPASAEAADLHMQPGIFSDPEYNPTITMGASVSHVTGSAHEYVFVNDGAYTLSRLDWQIKDVNTVNAEIGVRLTPWVAFKLAGSTILGDGQSEMDDYDWLLKGRDWTHWSNSPHTIVTDANRADVSGNLTLFRHPNFSLDAIGGVRWNQWGFEAYGGHYNYTDTTKPGAFRDLMGELPNDQPGIKYKQNLVTPYLGMQLNVMFDRFAFEAAVLASPFSTAQNYDEHFLRRILIHGGFHNGNYVDYKFGGSWRYSDKLSIVGGWERESYSLSKGSSNQSAIAYDTKKNLDPVVVNGGGGPQILPEPGKSSGFDNTTDRFNVGLVYSLY